MEQIIFHIDVNSAFLSWTAVKLLKEGNDVDVRTIPAIIGGDREKRHGIVLAKSISAQKYGIKTGEPVADALKKCPDIMIIPPEHEYYREQSRKFISILKEYTSDIEQVSVDECYFDYTGIQNKFSSYMSAAEVIKNRIQNELGFTVNIGISSKKVLAKMASDFEKPNKIHTLFPEEIKTKMWTLPVGELFMAGKSSVEVLNKLGIHTIGQLANTPVNIVESHLKKHGKILWEYANGIDDSKVNATKEDFKGIGNSTTLPTDLDKIDDINLVLLQLAVKVSGRLRESGQKAKTIAIEIKYNDFSKMSHQTSLYNATNVENEIYENAKQLFKDIWTGKQVRLLGIRTANLVGEDEPEQMSIFELMNEKQSQKVQPSREKMKKLDKALDAIKEKYGEDAVSRASLLNKDKIKKH